MIKDSGFIFSSNGGRLEKAAGSQKSYDRVSHTRHHIQKIHKSAKLLCSAYYTQISIDYTTNVY